MRGEVSVGGDMLTMFSPFAIFLIRLDQVTGDQEQGSIDSLIFLFRGPT